MSGGREVSTTTTTSTSDPTCYQAPVAGGGTPPRLCDVGRRPCPFLRFVSSPARTRYRVRRGEVGDGGVEDVWATGPGTRLGSFGSQRGRGDLLTRGPVKITSNTRRNLLLYWVQYCCMPVSVVPHI